MVETEAGIVGRVLLRTPLVAITDVTCRLEDGHAGSEVAAHDLVLLPRRGAYALQPGTRATVADATCAVLLARGTEYRVRHPVPGGDRTTAVAVARAAMGELDARIAGTRRRRPVEAVPVRPATDLGHRQLARALASGASDPLSVEAAALGLLADVHEASGIDRPVGAGRAATARARAARAVWVARAQIYLAARLDEPVSLADVAGHVAVSPFHLLRVFRAHTGIPIHRYHLRLRLRAAIQRLLAGEPDLARIAADLGFVDHAHLTRSLRRDTGLTPSAIRSGASVGRG